MSLDVMKCKIVSPEEANWCYEVKAWGETFTSIQKTGYIPVYEIRVGRNCLSKKWYKKDDALSNQESWTECGKLRLITKDELNKKLFPYIKGKKDGEWFNAELLFDGDFDFVWISW